MHKKSVGRKSHQLQGYTCKSSITVGYASFRSMTAIPSGNLRTKHSNSFLSFKSCLDWKKFQVYVCYHTKVAMCKNIQLIPRPLLKQYLIRKSHPIVVYFWIFCQTVKHSFIGIHINIACFIYLLWSKRLPGLQNKHPSI